MQANRQYNTPAVIWLTGLSGSGKTTIANALSALLKQIHIVPVVLDGDDMRGILQVNGFDEAARKKHNSVIGQLSAHFEEQGHVVIVAMISPYTAIREEVRALCKRFIEVHVATDLTTCIQRDPKGLYKKALAGELKNFTGVSATYEMPLQPDCRIDTVNRTAEDCAREILNTLNAQRGTRNTGFK